MGKTKIAVVKDVDISNGNQYPFLTFHGTLDELQIALLTKRFICFNYTGEELIFNTSHIVNLTLLGEDEVEV